MNTTQEIRVSALRQFNRTYTRQIGLLQEGYLESPFSLTEVRVLYELAYSRLVTASDLARDLRLDPGYLSRILNAFQRKGLIVRKRSAADGRQRHLSLTDAGRTAFAPLDRRSRDDIGKILADLTEANQVRLLEAIATIEQMLGDRPESTSPYILRSHRPGDMGWVVQRHGALYAAEYGWDADFEAMVATVAATFLTSFDLQREHCWIAERDGENIGCVFLVRESDTVAKLRLLLVEPSARGLGIGSRLVEECIRFARDEGYERITLWTNSVLGAARHLYHRAGFTLLAEDPHHSFGHDLIGETWDIDLRSLA